MALTSLFNADIDVLSLDSFEIIDGHKKGYCTSEIIDGCFNEATSNCITINLKGWSKYFINPIAVAVKVSDTTINGFLTQSSAWLMREKERERSPWQRIGMLF